MPAVDRLVLNLANLRVMQPEDFVADAQHGGVRLRRQSLGKFFRGLRRAPQPRVHRSSFWRNHHAAQELPAPGRAPGSAFDARRAVRAICATVVKRRQGMFYVVAYDISDDQRRLKVAKILEDFGDRAPSAACLKWSSTTPRGWSGSARGSSASSIRLPTTCAFIFFAKAAATKSVRLDRGRFTEMSPCTCCEPVMAVSNRRLPASPGEVRHCRQGLEIVEETAFSPAWKTPPKGSRQGAWRQVRQWGSAARQCVRPSGAYCWKF
ncbi:MAG: hypothetical protein KatS3mg131_2236 [Candidatus Tectimicrobiota bacterium]|nr:MAG: hypothetical protein KatS3mg131_2236 [Candidatus Tectomicrobia bacterium]